MAFSTLTRSIGAKLMLVVTLSLTASAAIIGAVGYYQQGALNRVAVQSALQRRFDYVVAAINDRGLRAEATAIVVANDPRVREALIRRDRPALLASQKDSYEASKQKLGLFLWSFESPEGIMLARIHAPEKFGDNLVGRRHLVEDVLKTGEMKYGVEPGLDSIAVFATVPVHADGKLVGLVDLGAALDVSFLESLKGASHVDLAFHLVKDGKIQTVAATFAEKTLLQPTQIQGAIAGQSAITRAVMQDKPRAVMAGPLLSYAGVAIGSIEVAMDISEYVAGENTALIFLGIAVGGVALMGVVIAWALNRHLARPIGRLNDVLLTFALGRYEQNVPAQDRQDEIGAIAKSVEILRQGALERDRLEAETLLNQERRSARGARRESVIERFSAEIGAMVESVSTNAGTMESTAQALTQMAGSTTDLAADAADSSRQSARNVQSVAAASEELARSSTEIAAKIGETNRIVLRANEEAAGANSRIKSLVEASSRIGDVVALIRAIASQTNLLALNATIEAARAGESGRGFAVVASEVKALAEQTAKATDEIARQIIAVQSETESAVMAIEAISETMETVASYAAAVADQIDQQRRATGEISQNVQAVATGTGAVVDTIGAVSATASETTQSANSMLQSSRDLSRQASALTDNISAFLTDIRNI